MSVNHKSKLICLAIACSLIVPVYSHAEEAVKDNGPTSSSDTGLKSALQHLKNNTVNAGAELLNALVPKATQYAKDVGYAAVCNDAVIRKHHDDMKQVISFIHQQTSDLVNIVNQSFDSNNVAETALAVQANEEEAVKKKIQELGNREKMRGSIVLAIYPLKKLVPFLKTCESDSLHFPTDILLKLDEVERNLEAVSSHLLSKNWIIPADYGSNLKEMSANIKTNMVKLKMKTIQLQLASGKLNELVVAYLSNKNSSEEEKLKLELEALQQQLGNE